MPTKLLSRQGDVLVYDWWVHGQWHHRNVGLGTQCTALGACWHAERVHLNQILVVVYLTTRISPRPGWIERDHYNNMRCVNSEHLCHSLHRAVVGERVNEATVLSGG